MWQRATYREFLVIISSFSFAREVNGGAKKVLHAASSRNFDDSITVSRGGCCYYSMAVCSLEAKAVRIESDHFE